MNSKVKLEGFPTQVGKEIELPNIAELLLYPFFLNAPADEFYKRGTDFHRKLINSAPLKHDKKYITITSHVQLLSPGDRAVVNKIGYDLEWHIDCHVFGKHRDRFHILMSDCSALTEFNTEPAEVETDDQITQLNFIRQLNDNEEKLGLKPKKVEPNRFTTFETHVHRAINPAQHEFRYFIRIAESNQLVPFGIDKAFNNHSNILRGRDVLGNVVHGPEGVIIQNIKPYRFR